MDRPLLIDPSVFPADDVLAGHLGRAFPAWPAFLELLKSVTPPRRSATQAPEQCVVLTAAKIGP